MSTSSIESRVAAALGLVLFLGAARYSDPGHHVSFAIPSGCTSSRLAAYQREVVSCHNGTAFSVFAAGGTDQPALQRLVDGVVGGWTHLKLIANDRHAKLGQRPARSVFAVGIRPDHAIANIQIAAVAKDGGWYALVCQSSTWEADEKRYFRTIAESFRFD